MSASIYILPKKTSRRYTTLLATRSRLTCAPTRHIRAQPRPTSIRRRCTSVMSRRALRCAKRRAIWRRRCDALWSFVESYMLKRKFFLQRSLIFSTDLSSSSCFHVFCRRRSACANRSLSRRRLIKCSSASQPKRSVNRRRWPSSRRFEK